MIQTISHRRARYVRGNNDKMETRLNIDVLATLTMKR